MAKPSRAYALDASPHWCEGLKYDRDFDEYLKKRVAGRCADREGVEKTVSDLGGFGADLLKTVAETPPPSSRMGECIAECFLEDERQSVLPNYVLDQKNPGASVAGADLVGICKKGNKALLLLGEAKTSQERKSPPSVMRKMTRQLTEIASSKRNRSLLIRWLAHKWTAHNLPLSHLASAIKSYRRGTYRLVGVLIRDTDPVPSDISPACSRLQNELSSGASLTLYALYIPVAIRDLVAARA